MPLADAGAYLSRDAIHRLRRRSNVRGAWLVLHAWGVIALAMAAFAWWPHPLTLVAGVVIVGGRQLGLAILMHDAAHGLLFHTRRVNDRVGRWLCGAPVIASMDLYRPYHLTHHRRTQQPDDPDLGLSAPFPITRASLRRKMVRDLTGQTAYQRRRLQLRDALGAPAWPWRRRLARAIIAPYFVNYHLEHHLLLFVPCWRLPEAHRALLEGGFGSRMEIQPGYRAMLSVATGAARDRGRPDPAPGGAQHI